MTDVGNEARLGLVCLLCVVLRHEQFLALLHELGAQPATLAQQMERYGECRDEHDDEHGDEQNGVAILLEDAQRLVHHVVVEAEALERELQHVQALQVEHIAVLHQSYRLLPARLQKLHHLVGKRAAHDMIARRIARHGPVAHSYVGEGERRQLRVGLSEGVRRVAHHIAVRVVHAPRT